jgi:UDP-N-acetylglucosamine 2-epimerase (hydrolysing)
MERRVKKIVFLTATRADFGKLKSLIKVIDESKTFECFVFVTGMHTLKKYGSTYDEVKKQRYKNIFVWPNQKDETNMDIILANTIKGFSKYINKIKPDMIVVHGDRVEPLAGAIVGTLNNILVSHVEGGEVSGTVDESMRHAISKLSQLHFTANKEAQRRLIQMGENAKSIFVIGSPDIDIMKSKNLPTIMQVKERYQIPYKKYSIFVYHPVTTEIKSLKRDIQKIVKAVCQSQKNYVFIYPNNDLGNDIILSEYKKLKNKKQIKIFPSLRFEYFLSLLKNAEFIIGNSSSGIREAEFFGVSAINIGTRQQNRTKNKDIINIKADTKEILNAIGEIKENKIKKSSNFGNGKSMEKFYEIISRSSFWKAKIQKQFLDLN